MRTSLTLFLPRLFVLLALFVSCLASLAPVAGHAATAATTARPSVFLDDLTWTEVRDALLAGSRTVIVPVGGTEQSGPHMALGKHNVRVKALAGRIAAGLGNALVAPVLAYVPEGAIASSGHMRFAGTVSVPDDAFRGILEGAARSYRQHGFTEVVLIGDHGGYQASLKAVAAKLNREWAGSPGERVAHAHFIAAYYDIAQTTYVQALRAKGLSEVQIGSHAGVADTSLMLALDPALVRTEHMPANAAEGKALGVAGDPRMSSAALGQLGVDAVVAGTVAAIRAALAADGATAPVSAPVSARR